MTEEELKIENDDLKSQLDSVLSKNREILGEVKKLKNASKEHNVDDLLSKLDEAETKNSKYESDFKKMKSENEKLTQGLGAKSEHLNKLLVEDGLTNALLSAGVDEKYLKGAKALLKGEVSLNDNFEATIGDKNLADFTSEWMKGDGAVYAKPTPSNGGGGNGGDSSSSEQTTKGDLNGSKAEQEAYIAAKFDIK